jgi:hypothetical protein
MLMYSRALTTRIGRHTDGRYELRPHESAMAEEETKPLTLVKTSLSKTRSVAVVLAVCALMFIGVLGLGSLTYGVRRQ